VIFILNMARREMRASWRRLILFFLCIAIGVAAMVSVHSFTDHLAVSMTRHARALMSADVRVETNRPWPADGSALLRRMTSSSRVTDYTEVIETETMARLVNAADSRPVMIQVRGVRDRFPLHGEVRLRSGAVYSHALLNNQGAMVSPALLSRLGVKVGDSIAIGSRTFEIRAAADRIPGSLMNFNPMARVIVDYDAVEAAGLTGFGSRVRYLWLYKTRDGQEVAFAQEIGREVRRIKAGAGIGTFRYIENWLNASLANFEGFTGLIGLAILVLGGIGIASVTRVFVQQKLKTIAILKCLGGRNVRVLGAYLTQTIALGLGGSLLGLVFAHLVSVVGVSYLEPLSPLSLRAGLTLRAVAEGVSIGMLITVMFSLPALLEIRRTKPNVLLRRDLERPAFDWVQLISRVLLAGAIGGLAIWQAGSYPGTRRLIGGVAATALALNVAGAGLIAALRRARRLPASFALRHGIMSLCRPGNQTKVVLFAVGIGALFILSVRLRLLDLQSEYRLDLSALSADMFFIDIQNDQRDAAETALASLGARDVRLAPVVRLRLVGSKWGPNHDPNDRPDVTAKRIGGETRVSYRQALDPSETIVAGQFWDGSRSAEPEISLEESQASWWNLKVGDTLFFEILGRRIEARVTSLRRLERRVRSMSPLTQFNVLFRPGVLESAPHTYIGALKGPPPGDDRARLQNAFVEAFPNVTLVDALGEIQEVRKRIGDLSVALTVLGGFVSGCGALILIGSIAVTRYQRVYEAAILKTIGARKSILVRMTLIEYGVLGLVAGCIGSAASIVLIWAMSATGAMQTPWRLHPAVNIIGIVLTVLLVMVVGVVSTWNVLTSKPIGTLREQ
jgi:putative ABC transport system permease protein